MLSPLERSRDQHPEAQRRPHRTEPLLEHTMVTTHRRASNSLSSSTTPTAFYAMSVMPRSLRGPVTSPTPSVDPVRDLCSDYTLVDVISILTSTSSLFWPLSTLSFCLACFPPRFSLCRAFLGSPSPLAPLSTLSLSYFFLGLRFRIPRLSGKKQQRRTQP